MRGLGSRLRKAKSESWSRFGLEGSNYVIWSWQVFVCFVCFIHSLVVFLAAGEREEEEVHR